MRAGALSARLRLERKVVVGRDDVNGDILEWRPQGEVWGEVIGIAGRAVHAGDEVREPGSIDIFIRKGQLSVDNTWRCFELTGVIPPGPVSIIGVLPTADPGKWRLQCTQGLRDD